ncbi:MAG: precorrin-8X methylmutase [Nostocaceae cyanobacterium]|nr:precorrin-8X methylmutase [Nostocaceae cyanobacterium]
MEWHITDAQNLAIIDRQISDGVFSPAEYEIVKRVVYATGDLEYKHLIKFSHHALQSGAAALAARTTIVVDVQMVQVGIAYNIQHTFANPVYCSMNVATYPQKQKTSVAWGIKTLAKRYPEAIFVVGQAQTAFAALMDLISSEEIRPTLIVATPPGFIGVEADKKSLQDSLIPHIIIENTKGNAVVATAIINGLIDLAWQAYGVKK